MEKRTEGNINIMTQSTLQDYIEANVEIAITNAEEIYTGSPIIGSMMRFTDEMLAEQMESQVIRIFNDVMIYSELITPYKLSENSLEAGVEAFLEEHVFLGEHYRFSSFNEDTIGLVQTFDGMPIENYEDDRFYLVLHLNENLEIEAYHQYYIQFNEDNQENREQELLSPLKAIENLYNNQRIPADSVVEHAELGYYSLLPASGEYQVFAPMWKITINGYYHYVDAINGQIQTIN
ncbi:regulatory protein YycI of two-component signal transduction system YycFG [Evansella vedderi]|uniref:Regulatory protein YycI of two-component signal transduction system YycFG n=1 Tax=Evansella vedderi TaxID=38282 RepID=A0ABU0A3K8_9BACI|nr:two-component system regulatory protein YycI [Evansella vedderi]MDQ0257592.1 regulatory protein YycI of two-component signal transduction system YycFG [Evansella vedderi]